MLRDDGTLWLNLGDSYAGSPAGNFGSGTAPADGGAFRCNKPKMKYPSYLKPKDLCGIPWRVAFALQQDGWYLRQDIIWHKPNPMPESVRDRCTKAHEYIFLLSKKPKYYCDMEAIKEESIWPDGPHAPQSIKAIDGCLGSRDNLNQIGASLTRNKRSVWTVTTKPYSEAHFATFPPDLILPCILAGCPQEVCVKCGEPRARIIEREHVGASTKRGSHDIGGNVYNVPQDNAKAIHTGWTDCGCGAGFRGGIVLDPFMGSGTTAVVAYQNNRHYVGVELNPEYCNLKRIQQEQDKYALFNE